MSDCKRERYNIALEITNTCLKMSRDFFSIKIRLHGAASEKREIEYNQHCAKRQIVTVILIYFTTGVLL